ncbi:HMG-box, partial [Agrocybe pediades]
MEIDGVADTPRTQLKKQRRKNPIPRPPNSYMIFRAAKQSIFRKFIKDDDVNQINSQISKLSAIWWKAMNPKEKAIWDKEADEAKLEHMKKYPDYKYTPARRNQKQ